MYREAMELIELKRELTPEHKAIGLYWADNPGETATPAGHWTAIASQLTSQRGLSAEAAARLFLVGSAAQADAFLASWGYKYQYNQIRPRTYIRRVIDSAWEPQVPTPPFPEYPSGHSTQSAAASVALQALLSLRRRDCSRSDPPRAGVVRGRAAENSCGGIHFHNERPAARGRLHGTSGRALPAGILWGPHLH
jgi:hypothetical protein